METLKRYRLWAIVVSCCMIVLGAAMILRPDISALAVCYLTGALCIAMGVCEIARYFSIGVIGILFRFDLIVGIIVSIYLMTMKEKSLARCCKAVYALFDEKKANAVVHGTRQVDRIFSGFVRGKLLDSLIIGALCFIGGSILKLPYTPLVSVVVGVTNVIPFFGPFLGAIPSAFLILLVSPKQCLIFVIFIVVLQQFDGNILGPKILGDATGISSFWVIVAILVGGGFGGVLGMFIGVPVFACAQELLKYLMDKRLRKRNMPTEAYAYVGRAKDDPAETTEETTTDNDKGTV